MKLCIAKFEQLMEHDELIQKHGVQVNILGEIGLLPRELQETLAKVMLTSRDNSRAVLNVCLAYSGRREIVEASKKLAAAVTSGELEERDITEALYERCLYTADTSPPDLLIRTSGEVRAVKPCMNSGCARVVGARLCLWGGEAVSSDVALNEILHLGERCGSPTFSCGRRATHACVSPRSFGRRSRSPTFSCVCLPTIAIRLPNAGVRGRQH